MLPLLPLIAFFLFYYWIVLSEMRDQHPIRRFAWLIIFPFWISLLYFLVLMLPYPPYSFFVLFIVVFFVMLFFIALGEAYDKTPWIKEVS